ncbi:protein-disulfide isomerase [Sediminihabitans luteus]|uniref:Protein-disulfide isomerase n=1 Tax=Sediminihabitans luteus TaxID=1138585 RepID=A0A2M9CE92_9CELL|nr:thioredoxin domain-containing protein [Sediminihabitans luteus]PJJ70197.1 protein-disulfide isomerase [Sediminihabitans luteus]GII97668.1 hypothetical protein Slu03_00460 [Sediminihabitans luteus]
MAKNDSTPKAPSKTNMTKAERREAALAEAERLRKAQAARDKRTRIITVSALVAAIVVVAVVVFLILNEGGKKDADPMYGVTPPATASADGGISIGEAGEAGTSTDGAVEVDVYLDFMCPICGDFESVNGATLDALREDGTITEVVHPVSILDRLSEGTEFSTRSSAAAGYVAENAPEQFGAFVDAMFANQPKENTVGLSDDQIAQIAVGAGVAQDVADDIAAGKATDTFADWSEAITTLATQDEDLANPQSGSFGTPTIVIDGELFTGNWATAGELEAAIQAAAK